jgi:hypothetical protein
MAKFGVGVEKNRCRTNANAKNLKSNLRNQNRQHSRSYGEMDGRVGVAHAKIHNTGGASLIRLILRAPPKVTFKMRRPQLPRLDASARFCPYWTIDRPHDHCVRVCYKSHRTFQT